MWLRYSPWIWYSVNEKLKPREEKNKLWDQDKVINLEKSEKTRAYITSREPHCDYILSYICHVQIELPFLKQSAMYVSDTEG